MRDRGETRDLREHPKKICSEMKAWEREEIEKNKNKNKTRLWDFGEGRREKTLGVLGNSEATCMWRWLYNCTVNHPIPPIKSKILKLNKRMNVW